jgi:mRNA interferase MazF
LREKILISGEIWYVSLDPTVGDELQKIRPVVVLNPGHDRHLRLAVVVPVTGWRQGWQGNPFFVKLDPAPTNGLEKTSAVDCFQIRSLSHRRFKRHLGNISDAVLDQVLSAVALILDIDSVHCETVV